MTGTIEKIEYTHNSPFGEQHTTIDGVTYWTWFDLREISVRAGKRVEHEPKLDYPMNLNGQDFSVAVTRITKVL